MQRPRRSWPGPSRPGCSADPGRVAEQHQRARDHAAGEDAVELADAAQEPLRALGLDLAQRARRARGHEHARAPLAPSRSAGAVRPRAVFQAAAGALPPPGQRTRPTPCRRAVSVPSPPERSSQARPTPALNAPGSPRRADDAAGATRWSGRAPRRRRRTRREADQRDDRRDHEEALDRVAALSSPAARRCRACCGSTRRVGAPRASRAISRARTHEAISSSP